MKMHSLVFSANINDKSHCTLDHSSAVHDNFVSPF